MKHIFLVSLAIILVGGMIFTGCAKEVTPTTEEPVEVSIYSMSAGNCCYACAVVLAEDINKRSKWLKVTAPEGFNAMTTLKTLVEKPELRKNTFIWNSYGTIFIANLHVGQTGDPPFNTFDYNEFVPCFLHGIGASLLITRDPNIKTLKDLDGKTIRIGASAGDWKYPIWEEAIKHAGAAPKEYVFMATGAGVSALRDGLIDVCGVGCSPTPDAGWTPSAGLPDAIAQIHPFYYITPDRVDLEAACQAFDYLVPLATIPAGDLDPGQKTDLLAINQTMWFGAHKSFPDEVVTEIMGVVWETCETWKEYHPAAATVTRKTLGALGVPESAYHPAALKFLKEKGVAITSWGNW